MLNIHIIVPRYHTNLEPVLTEFLNLGHKVYIYSFSQSIAEIRDPRKNLYFKDFASSEDRKIILVKMAQFLNALNSNIIKNSNNIFFARCELSSVGTMILLAILLLKCRKKTVVFTQYPIKSAKLHQILWRFFINKFLKIRYFTQVITKMDLTERFYINRSQYIKSLKNLISRNSDYIPLALPRIDVNNLPDSFDNIEMFEGKTFVTVAKCEPRKGIDTLIECFQEIEKETKVNLKLHLVLQVLNVRHQRFLVQIIDKYRLREVTNIKIWINMSPKDTRAIIYLSDVFVLNSAKEPASFSHLEALAMDIPIILSKENGSANVLPNQFGVSKISSSLDLKRTMISCLSNIVVNKKDVHNLRLDLEEVIGADEIARNWLSRFSDCFNEDGSIKN